MHFYESMQIFGAVFGMPEFIVNCGTEDSYLLYGDEKYVISVKNARADAPFAGDESDKNVLKRYLYKVLSEIYGYKSPWGCMTGVRPAKILHTLYMKGMTRDDARQWFRDFYLMSETKINLCFETFENQRKFLYENETKKCGFYVGIPFCPTICTYCTFGSSPLSRYKKRVDEYLDALTEEISVTVDALTKENYEIESLYIGGGTPTSLNEAQLERLLRVVTEKIDVSKLDEFSVEAGRPDTITPEKLDVIKKYGATRISINPQSMNENTLRRVGRSHSPEDVKEIFAYAREKHFENINMDIIAGLPGEHLTDFLNTVDEITGLGPECITVHTLSLKRASELTRNESEHDDLAAFETEDMTRLAYEKITSCGLRPFYMYRQKNCIGNNENVCYCIPGNESPYNVHIMEEDMTIFACGAGAVTKVVTGGNINRFFNMKSVEEYISRFENELLKKQDFIEETARV